LSMDKALPQHDCKKFVQQVFLVLDGELTKEETDLFLTDIERCKHCLDHYNIERELKDFIAKRVEKRCCSEGLKSSIKEQIKSLSGSGE
jgi:anti-sigma factor (TIGR02949 family)